MWNTKEGSIASFKMACRLRSLLRDGDAVRRPHEAVCRRQEHLRVVCVSTKFTLVEYVQYPPEAVTARDSGALLHLVLLPLSVSVLEGVLSLTLHVTTYAEHSQYATNEWYIVFLNRQCMGRCGI